MVAIPDTSQPEYVLLVSLEYKNLFQTYLLMSPVLCLLFDLLGALFV